jgi:hypothetical protein
VDAIFIWCIHITNILLVALGMRILAVNSGCIWVGTVVDLAVGVGVGTCWGSEAMSADIVGEIGVASGVFVVFLKVLVVGFVPDVATANNHQDYDKDAGKDDQAGNSERCHNGTLVFPESFL